MLKMTVVFKSYFPPAEPKKTLIFLTLSQGQTEYTILFFLNQIFLRLCLWMKSYGMAIKMKPLQQYLCMVLFRFV